MALSRGSDNDPIGIRLARQSKHAFGEDQLEDHVLAVVPSPTHLNQRTGARYEVVCPGSHVRKPARVPGRTLSDYLGLWTESAPLCNAGLNLAVSLAAGLALAALGRALGGLL